MYLGVLWVIETQGTVSSELGMKEAFVVYGDQLSSFILSEVSSMRYPWFFEILDLTRVLPSLSLIILRAFCCLRNWLR